MIAGAAVAKKGFDLIRIFTRVGDIGYLAAVNMRLVTTATERQHATTYVFDDSDAPLHIDIPFEDFVEQWREALSETP